MNQALHSFMGSPAVPEAPKQAPLRYCLYARKSTEDDEKQALSIDSQIKEMIEVAKRDNLNVIEIKRESHSAKASGTRAVFLELLDELRRGKYNAILTWAPDRLSRNGGDLGSVVDLIDQKKLIEIRTYSQKFTNSPNEKFLLMILGSQAKLENDNKSINVKRGLKTRAEMGLWPCVAPTGYLNEKILGRECYVIVDPIRGPVIKQMFEKVGIERWSGRKVFRWLKEDIKFKSRNNTNLNLGTIYNLLRLPFFSGIFEYPRGSGNWYEGKHQPLISRELFQKVQEKLSEENRPKTKFKEFTFTKLMTCGHCGSGITAQEKIKNIKSDGSSRAYIYYSCTKHKDHNCKNPYINEDQLIEQLSELIDQVSLDEIGAKELLKREIAKHNTLRAYVFGITDKDKMPDIDTRHYAKYLLKEGTIYEKRELLEHLKNRIVLKDRKISLENQLQ